MLYKHGDDDDDGDGVDISCLSGQHQTGRLSKAKKRPEVLYIQVTEAVISEQHRLPATYSWGLPVGGERREGLPSHCPRVRLALSCRGISG